jgi:hypothetical protein
MPDFYGGLVIGCIIGVLIGVVGSFAWAVSISEKEGKK